MADDKTSNVKVRVLVNRSRGRAPEILKIARILLGPVLYSEGGAHMTIEATEAIGGVDLHHGWG